MKVLFKSHIFLKIFGGTVTGVLLFSALVLLFSVPAIDRQIFAIETRAARTILDNVLAITQQGQHNLQTYRETSLSARKRELGTVLDLAESLIRAQWSRVSRGEMTEQAARKDILETVRRLHFGKQDYVWISDYHSVLISHPDPALNGADFSSVRDIHGRLIVPPMVEMARRDGQGYHTYWWRRLNESRPVKKLASFRHLPDIGWVIGTGVYLDDIELELAERRQALIDELRQKFHRLKIAKTGYVYVFDRNFNMLIHPNPNIESRNFRELKNPVNGRPLAPQLVAAAGKEGGLRYLWDRPGDPGRYIHEKISWVVYEPDLGWYVASSVYLDELKSSSRELKWRIILVSLAVLLAATIGAWLFSRRLTRPLLDLARLARRVQDGDYSGRSKTESADEIGILTRTFNQMLDRIEDSIKNLDSQVAKRTADLERALTELRQLDIMKSAFLANVSHEMRTPLTSIQGFADLTRRKFEKSILPLLSHENSIRATKGGEQIVKNLSIIAEESRQLSAMIDNALDLSGMEEGRTPWEEAPVAIRELIEQTAAEMAPQAAERGLLLRLDLPEELPQIRGDRRRLRQVLAHLLSNAIKFTETGSISCRAEEREGLLKVSLADTGIGIAQENHGLIFEKFRQVGDVMTGKPKGSGLGLALSKRIVEHHGGTIGVESEPGLGSTFFFTLPLSPTDEAKQPEQS